MEVFNNDNGSVKKVRSRFSRKREICLTRWKDAVYVHLNDISKCWEDDKFDITRQKSISMKWEEAELLRDTLAELVPHVQQMLSEMVSQIFVIFVYFQFDIDNFRK